MPAFPPVYSPVRIASVFKATSTIVLRSYCRDARARALQELRTRYPTHEPLLTDSGTSALALALRWSSEGTIGVESTRRVALPAYGCPDLLSAALYSGYRVSLYDLDPSTLAPDLESLTEVLQQGCSHVVVTHLYGRIVDLAPIMNAAQMAGAIVIEDAAQHAGGALRDVRGGGQAAWGVLSFGRGKGLNAGGGGALLTPVAYKAGTSAFKPLVSPSAAQGAAGLAKVMATEILGTPAWYGLVRNLPGLGIGATEFHPLKKVRAASPVVCALLLDALEQEPALLTHRRDMVAFYREALSDFPQAICAPASDEHQQGALRFPVKLDASPERTLESLGVVQSYPRTLAEYPQVRPVLDNVSHRWPGAEELARRLHTLPTHSRITMAIRRDIVGRLIESLRVSR